MAVCLTAEGMVCDWERYGVERRRCAVKVSQSAHQRCDAPASDGGVRPRRRRRSMKPRPHRWSSLSDEGRGSSVVGSGGVAGDNPSTRGPHRGARCGSIEPRTVSTVVAGCMDAGLDVVASMPECIVSNRRWAIANRRTSCVLDASEVQLLQLHHPGSSARKRLLIQNVRCPQSSTLRGTSSSRCQRLVQSIQIL